MKISPVTSLLLSSLLLSACAEPSLVVGQPGPALSSAEVSIYYIDRPRCDFETVAYIRARGLYFSLQTMFRDMRLKAAQLGADGLYVLQTQQLDTREFLGTAKAIRCLPV